MEINETTIYELTWLTKEELIKKYNLTNTELKNILKENNIVRPPYGEITKHKNECLYLEKLKQIDLKAFKEFFKLNSRDKTIEHFNIDYGMFFFIIKKNNLKKSKEELQKSKELTLIEKYGSLENYYEQMTQKQKLAVLEKYGTEYYTKSDHYKNHLTEYQEKSKQVCKEKYNCENPFGLNNWDHKKATDKAFNTKKLHGTTNTSKIQTLLTDKLKEIYGDSDIFTEYKEERYPYHCDIYIKSLDTFIELNLFFTHGKHPFNSDSEEDIKLLETWKMKSTRSRFFRNAIDVWTVSDPEKQKCARDNNLNYIMFYTEQEVKEYIKKLEDK